MISKSLLQQYACRPECEAFGREQATFFLKKADLQIPPNLFLEMRHQREQVALRHLPYAQAIGASLLGTKKIDVVPLPHLGTFYLLYRIETGEGARCYLRANLFLKHHPAFSFLLDGWAHTILPSWGVPTVSVLAVELTPSVIPFDYMVSLEGEGHPLKQQEHPQTQAIEPTLLIQLGQAVARLHKLTGNKYGLLDIAFLREEPSTPTGLHSSWADYLFLQLEEHVRICEEANKLSSSEAASVHFHFHQSRSEFEKAPSCLLHGDLGNHNVLTDGKTILSLLDWEDALCGDPIFDIAGWGTFNREEMLPPFLEGYTSITPLPSDFEWRYWLYYLRIALAKTVHRLRFQVPDPPHRPPPHRRIQKALEHLARLG